MKVGAALEDILDRADALRINGEYCEAQPLYEELVAGDANHARAWNGLGHCQLNQGDFDGSVASYRRAAELAPGDIRMTLDLGKVLCMVGEYEEARQVFEEVLAKDPDNAEAHNQLAYLP